MTLDRWYLFPTILFMAGKVAPVVDLGSASRTWTWVRNWHLEICTLQSLKLNEFDGRCPLYIPTRTIEVNAESAKNRFLKTGLTGLNG